jgi:hypothetical protein
MNAEEPGTRLPWIGQAPRQPLCDVPWFGNFVIIGNGEANFCCFSPVSVGNVNQQPFDEIWNGPTMRRIRRTLADQQFPPECQTVSCPIYRADEHHFIRARMEGSYVPTTPGEGRHREVKQAMAEGLSCSPANEGGPRLLVRYRGPLVYGDLYACLVRTGEPIAFLPTMDSFPLPFAVGQSFSAEEDEREIVLPTLPEADSATSIVVAIFESGSRPTIPENCFWSGRLEGSDTSHR